MSERQAQTTPDHAELRLEQEFHRRSECQTTSPAITHREGDLAVCPNCRRDLVYPTDWEPATEGMWAVSLRCPECEWRGGGVYPQGLVDRFDEVLDDATQSVLDDLELLTRANMQEQIDLFAEALEHDLIIPDDF